MSLAGKVYWAIHRGFRTAHWQQGPLIYTLVSDPDEADLSRLVEKLQYKSDSLEPFAHFSVYNIGGREV